MHRRTLLFALITASSSVACSKSGPPEKTQISPVPAALAATKPEPAKAPITLTVGHDAWVGYSGVFLAADLGFFKDAGLDVKLKPFSNPGDTLPALVAGQLDIGLTTLQNLAVL